MSKCPEGTTEKSIVQCITAPCPTNCVDKDGNIVNKVQVQDGNVAEKSTNWLAIIGITALAYFILYKAGSFKNS